MANEHNGQLQKLQSEFKKLQKSHQQTLEILREENDSIREVIDEKNATISELERFRTETDKLRKEHEQQESVYVGEIARLKEEKNTILSYSGDNKENRLEVRLRNT